MSPRSFPSLAMAATTLLLSVTPTLATAQVGPGGGRGNLDLNGDGVITAEEFEAQGQRRFKRLDANQDGAIDQAELSQRGEGMAKGRAGRRASADGPPAQGGAPGLLWRLDVNQDGRITEAEVLAGQKLRFAKADANGDGRLDSAEAQSLRPRGLGAGPRG